MIEGEKKEAVTRSLLRLEGEQMSMWQEITKLREKTRELQ